MKLLRAYINGGWVDLPTPAPENYEFQSEWREKSFRDSNQYLHRDMIRKIRKVNCGWNALNGDETTLLDSLYDLESFTLECTDNRNNRVRMKVYAGPISSKAKFMNKSTLAITLRTDVSMNFIEF